MTPDEFRDYVKAEFRKRLSDAIEIRAASFQSTGDYFEFGIMLLHDGKPRWGGNYWVKIWDQPGFEEQLVQRWLLEAFTDAVASIPPAPESAAA